MRHKRPLRLGCSSAPPRLSPAPTHLGFLVGTIEVGATSVPRELANVTIHFFPDPCSSSSGMGWMSPHGGHTLKPRRAGGGTTEGKPLRSVGTRPHTPETPRKGGPGRSCSFLRGCARARTAGRAGTGPGTPVRSRRPPPSPNQKRKEPGAASPTLPRRVRREVAARLQARGAAAL